MSYTGPIINSHDLCRWRFLLPYRCIYIDISALKPCTPGLYNRKVVPLEVGQVGHWVCACPKGNKYLDLPPFSFWLPIHEVSGFVLLWASALSSHRDAWLCFRPKEGNHIIKVFRLPVTSKVNKLCLGSLRITLKEKRQRIAKLHSKPVNAAGWGRVD